MLLWGMENHGGTLPRKDLDTIKEFSLNADFKVIHSSPERFFAEISPTLVYDGDLRPCFIKTYSSMSRVKKKHAELESKLFTTEKLCSLAAVRGKYDYNFSAFKKVEETLATIEFHDVLAGTCDPQGEHDTLQKADFALEILNNEFLKAFFAIVKDYKEAAATIYTLGMEKNGLKVKKILICISRKTQGYAQNNYFNTKKHNVAFMRAAGGNVDKRIIRKTRRRGKRLRCHNIDRNNAYNRLFSDADNEVIEAPERDGIYTHGRGYRSVLS